MPLIALPVGAREGTQAKAGNHGSPLFLFPHSTRPRVSKSEQEYSGLSGRSILILLTSYHLYLSEGFFLPLSYKCGFHRRRGGAASP